MTPLTRAAAHSIARKITDAWLEYLPDSAVIGGSWLLALEYKIIDAFMEAAKQVVWPEKKMRIKTDVPHCSVKGENIWVSGYNAAIDDFRRLNPTLVLNNQHGSDHGETK